ncbi:alpha/beta fold hydrolase [Nocardioides sp. GY 10127]|uniref:alpha/beta fold hydrolase n=1 Tax=Nocardioides sp. GY 10127 TaxID=2569762 RepID=UPI0010A86DF9|nr:alpha/beta fold hydrolase [Nocardioides sp. GY 10127]TIC81956.1 alpha/beta fold hydrolase [Nocardioides sp. GY 10127]
MDVLPTPGQLLTAAGSLTRLALGRLPVGPLAGRGLADLRAHDAAVLAATPEGGIVSRYEGGATSTGAPVVLVAPPGASARVYDLRRGCSLVGHLLDGGRATFLVELPEPWDTGVPLTERLTAVLGCLPTAAVASSTGTVHLLGWGLGGALAVLAAAADPDRVASVTTLGTPWSLEHVPLSVPPRPILAASEGAVRVGWKVASGVGATVPVARAALESPLVDRVVGTPLTVVSRLDDPEFLAQLEAVEALRAAAAGPREDEHAYGGRTYGQVFHRLLGPLVRDDGPATDLSGVRAPVLALSGATDAIVPPDAVRGLVDALVAARGREVESRWEIVPGGHLGQLTGRGAAVGTWPVLDEWFASTDPMPAPASFRKAAAKKATADKAAAKKAAAKKTTAKKAAPAKAAPRGTASKDAIGSNPSRRYSSGSSRGLAGGTRPPFD